MKFTKTQFTESSRLKKYEDKIAEILIIENSLDVESLYEMGDFRFKASFETLLQIATYSDTLIIQEDRIAYNGLVATVTYSITGNNITGVFLAGRSGRIPNDKVKRVRMNAAYNFDLSVVHSGGDWIFNTTKIAVSDGTSRKLSTPKRSNKSNELIITVKA